MLTTIERFKSIQPYDDGSTDDMIMLQISAASSRIEQHCKRSFKKQSYSERVSGYHNSKYINLRNYPIDSISEMNVEGYEILDEGRIYHSHGWPQGDHNIKVTYVGGYILPTDGTVDKPRTLPEPLELACLLYVQSLMRTPGIKSERVGDISVGYSDDSDSLPPAVASLISPYVGRWV
ncbi:head-tail connector protein [Paenibacillus macquariensis]|uniref:Phage gp6-like head-tail connector protein n=1 Tax=Paenibacillus macquariensis TaxID=948756 RepID=A0ABY1JS97_9BACL|nr:phage gp6-like head-tail connector protein [Paenibacillus macquariensis]MEC0092880.1 phage gp6-like head-tail connector protein [Paenibacillus macquariensis]OAB36253.1 hypothetical protein PMSM_07340 [Paenibacillus macquariensis subsp. macquariensis]SIQ68040.1 hypothetical protein SAMN05421578_103334 [Paenibacillus macquariensis]